MRGAPPSRVDVNLTRKSAVLLPSARAGVDRAADRGDRAAADRQPARRRGVEPRRRGRRGRSPCSRRSGRRTSRPGRATGTSSEMPPPAPAQILPLAFVTFQVARKSYALWPPRREVVVDVDRVAPGRQALDREAERDDAALGVPRVVAVEVAVLPGVVLARPLVEVDPGGRGPDARHAPHEQEQDDGDGEDPDADGDPLAAHAANAVSVQIPERIACASEWHSHRSSHPGDLRESRERAVSGPTGSRCRLVHQSGAARPNRPAGHRAGPSSRSSRCPAAPDRAAGQVLPAATPRSAGTISRP